MQHVRRQPDARAGPRSVAQRPVARDVGEAVVRARRQHQIDRDAAARREGSAISRVASGTKYGVTARMRSRAMRRRSPAAPGRCRRPGRDRSGPAGRAARASALRRPRAPAERGGGGRRRVVSSRGRSAAGPAAASGAAQVEAEVVPGAARRRPSPSKYSPARLRPPHPEAARRSTISILRWLRRLVRPRSGDCSGGTNLTTSTPAARSAAEVEPAAEQPPKPSSSSRTLTPARARGSAARRPLAEASRARMKVQTSSVRVAPAISRASAAQRVGAVGVHRQARGSSPRRRAPSRGRAPRPHRPLVGGRSAHGRGCRRGPRSSSLRLPNIT